MSLLARLWHMMGLERVRRDGLFAKKLSREEKLTDKERERRKKEFDDEIDLLRQELRVLTQSDDDTP